MATIEQKRAKIETLQRQIKRLRKEALTRIYYLDMQILKLQDEIHSLRAKEA